MTDSELKSNCQISCVIHLIHEVFVIGIIESPCSTAGSSELFILPQQFCIRQCHDYLSLSFIAQP
jgi:hypothetical protein